ncbi:MAG: ParA family protein [Gammaproteobacteria bacterium]|nr:ParA family protein [Gammaproteobacteria bacterium]
MKTWAVINQKGGVGKTTTALTLAGHLSHTNQRLLLIDLDPHGSLTSYLGYDPDEIETGLYSLFSSPTDNQVDIAKMLLPTSIKNTYLFAASSALATLDRQMGSGMGKGLVVRRAIQSVASRFSYGIIDCPPMLGILMINALAACDQLLIPAQTDYLSLKGLDRMIHTLGMVEKSQHRKTPYLIVPTMYDQRTRASIDALQKMKDLYRFNVWGSVIPIDTKFRDASKAGQPLSLLYPKSRGSTAYRKLLNFLLGIQEGQEYVRETQQQSA